MPYRIQCPCCLRTVSSDAYSCPHCGRNIHAFLKAKNVNEPHVEKISKYGRNSVLAILGVVLFILIFGSLSIFVSVYALLYSFIFLGIGEFVLSALLLCGFLIILSVICCSITAVGSFVLIKKVKKFVKKNNEAIDLEKIKMVSEDYFK